jgi:hypothetical protein
MVAQFFRNIDITDIFHVVSHLDQSPCSHRERGTRQVFFSALLVPFILLAYSLSGWADTISPGKKIGGASALLSILPGSGLRYATSFGEQILCSVAGRVACPGDDVLVSPHPY